MVRSLTAVLALTAAVLATGVATWGASAHPVYVPHKIGFSYPIHLPGHGPGFGYGFGYGGALLGGLALGAIAADVAESDCTIVRRVMTDEYGNQYLRRVRVCD